MAKYNSQNGVVNLCSPIYIRLADVYLIRAEANAKLGNNEVAIADVNLIRQRAGYSGDGLFVHSITSDNRTEFYEHKWIAQKLNTNYYFAHPYAFWERGLNEYTNGLVRQYIPKKESFVHYPDSNIQNFQHKINRRPRKLLNFENPKNKFFLLLNNKVAFDS